ncbi:hypothetical protein DJ568_07020 [Mucilaginibacter hurinus]|uniref:Uncharacterized protein n=1 Tax=Mucilaginibacter hurinus TaxID=2201324 RepID=A0A367GQ98_9SPHI|nr:hypothetical protein [Mucilaginibacter hurinus]RCH55632.1 hypothetical protein DJ568_07020 [Mucilaginibacter hurinus]
MSRTIYLNNIDPDEMYDTFIKIEQSFGIKFIQADMDNLYTLGDLYNVVHSKIDLIHQDSCTTQQAFYNLRSILVAYTDVDKKDITPKTAIKDVFYNELWLIEKVKQQTGIDIAVLQMKGSVVLCLLLLFVAGCLACCFNLLVALLIFSAFTVSLLIADKFGKEISVKTVGEMAGKMAREHYLQSRKYRNTVNRNEINKKIQELFKRDFAIDSSSLTPNASLFRS